MRAAIIVVLTLISTGCAYLPTGISQVQLTARDGGAVYYGSVRREGLALVSMTVDVDRRIYLGNVELTSANSTFGLSQRYGAREAAPVNRLMNCDFTDVAGANAGGLCVDEAQRVYDVIFS